MGEIRDHISYNIRAYRLANKMTQKELADHLGVKATTVSSWERGANAPDIELLFRICDLFGISVAEMYGKDVSASSILAAPILSPDEQKLIDDYRTLNDQGKEHIRICMASAQALFKAESGDISSLESKSS